MGCVVARTQDKSINIRQPYSDQGANAFSGRSLDERVINPFFQAHHIPSSRGPYLSVFRRSVQFNKATRSGLRDQAGYDALLTLIGYVQSVVSDDELRAFLLHLLYRFAELREAARVELFKPHRLSLEQYDALISQLLTTPSGGRFPVVLVIAAFQAIREFFGLKWDVQYQGINVADTASGAGGDITIVSEGRILMAAEVTERPVDKTRVSATFNTKIAPSGIEDNLFFVHVSKVAADAREQARQYFAQGHEVNFLEIKDWILMSLATMGSKGRTAFGQQILALMESKEMPQALKVSWNDTVSKVIG